MPTLRPGFVASTCFLRSVHRLLAWCEAIYVNFVLPLGKLLVGWYPPAKGTTIRGRVQTQGETFGKAYADGEGLHATSLPRSRYSHGPRALRRELSLQCPILAQGCACHYVPASPRRLSPEGGFIDGALGQPAKYELFPTK